MKKYILPLLLAAIISGCSDVKEHGNGNMTTEKHHVNDFDEIEIGGNFTITLIKGKPEVVILADENLHEFISVSSERKNLVIETTEKIDSDEGMDITIYYQDIEDIELNGSSLLTNEEIIEGRDLNISLSGAGVIKLKVDSRDLDIDISGAGLIELAGNTRNLNVKISGAGNLSAYDLLTENCNVELSGVGAAQVNCEAYLRAEVSGVGGVNYKGSPEKVDSNVSGMGKVKEADPSDEGINIDLDN